MTFLKGDGEIWFKTDNKDLYEYSYITFGENHWNIIENVLPQLLNHRRTPGAGS